MAFLSVSFCGARCAIPWVGLFLVALGGCGDPHLGSSDQTAEIQAEGQELLSKMREAYRSVQTYTDNSVIVGYGVLRSTGSEVRTPYTHMSLAWEKPTRIRLSYENSFESSEGHVKYDVASNGEVVRSSAREVPDQIHEAIAPRQFTVENLVPDAALRREFFSFGLENRYPQLRFLLSEDDQEPVIC